MGDKQYFFKGDPFVRFPQPINRLALELLAQHATTRKPKFEQWDIDDYELHTHPDLIERLQILSKKLPVDCDNAAFGCFILVAPNGIIFSVARGTRWFAFRLSPDACALAESFSGKRSEQFGDTWIEIDPWGSDVVTAKYLSDLDYWCSEAFRYAIATELTTN